MVAKKSTEISESASEKIDAIHLLVTEIAVHTSYLKNLNPIASVFKLFGAIAVFIVVLFALYIGKNIQLDKGGFSTVDPAYCKEK